MIFPTHGPGLKALEEYIDQEGPAKCYVADQRTLDMYFGFREPFLGLPLNRVTDKKKDFSIH